MVLKNKSKEHEFHFEEKKMIDACGLVQEYSDNEVSMLIERIKLILGHIIKKEGK